MGGVLGLLLMQIQVKFAVFLGALEKLAVAAAAVRLGVRYHLVYFCVLPRVRVPYVRAVSSQLPH
jgi:hypothetical protein